MGNGAFIMINLPSSALLAMFRRGSTREDPFGFDAIVRQQ
jgi:hypothetical protein